MQPGPPLPASLGDVSADWVSAVLAPRFPGAEVADVLVGQPIHGTATNVPVQVRWLTNGTPPLPERMWLKGGYEDHSPHLAADLVYESEAAFYRDLAPSLPLRTPTCFYAGTDPETHQGVVLLEDLADAGARFGNALNPATVDEAARVLAALAQLHAATWGRALDREHPLVQRGIPLDGPGALWFSSQTPDVFEEWFDRRATVPIPRSVRNAERIVKAFWALVARTGDDPTCLIHSDAHIDNVYFLDAEPGFLDFQSLRVSSWAWDVSYFLAKSLDIGDRRRAERDLLNGYLKELAAHGVAAPGFDDAWVAYRRYVAYAFFCAVVNPDAFKPPEINAAWLERAAAAAEDLDTFAALEV